MSGWVYRFLARFRALFDDRRLESDLDEELKHHLELLTEENEKRGMSVREARRQAHIALGGIEQLREVHREARSVLWMENVLRDFRYSARSLWKAKGFSLAVMATLALCIGVNTAIFSSLHQLVIKPLPFEGGDRIVQVFNYVEGWDTDGSYSGWKQYKDFSEQADLFEGFVLSLVEEKVCDGSSTWVMGLSANFLEFFDVRPVVGRFFTPDEVFPQKAKLALLSYTNWVSNYDADPAVIGRSIEILNEGSYLIIGVAPKSIEAFDARARIFIPVPLYPAEMNPQHLTSRIGSKDLWGRLKHGVSLEEGETQLTYLDKRWYEINEEGFKNSHIEDRPERMVLNKPNPLASRLWLLQAGAVFVLLVGCTNVANLLLSRATARCRELSVRHALGARAGSLSRLIFAESLWLALAGTVLGCLLATASMYLINGYIQFILPKALPVTLTTDVFLWTVLVVIGITLVMGILPWIVLWRAGRIQVVDDSTRSASVGYGARVFSNSLVISQVAVTFVLLIGAGLLFQSFLRVLSVDPGFETEQIVQGRVDVFEAIPEWERMKEIRGVVLESVKDIPGVDDVTAARFESVGEVLRQRKIALRSEAYVGMIEAPAVIDLKVASNYHSAMDVEILEGRCFDSGEAGAYIVDQLFVEKYLTGQDPIGSEVKIFEGPLKNVTDWGRIVGVAKRANVNGLDQRDAGKAVVYSCLDQRPYTQVTLFLRTNRPLQELAGDVQTQLREIHPGLYFKNPITLDVALNNLHLYRQGLTLLAGVFALLALLLSAVGIYGVLSYDVNQRYREIGIRTAIGASAVQVLRHILGQGMVKTSAGLVVGLLGSIYLTRFLQAQLFDVGLFDALTYLAVFGFFVVVALIASFLPALKAVRVDPAEALRAE